MKDFFFFFSRSFQATTKPFPPTEDRSIELPHSEKSHARLVAVTVTLYLLFLVCYFCLFDFCFYLLRFSTSLLQIVSFFLCLSGSGNSRLHTYWSEEICDSLPSPGSIMSQCLLLFSIDLSRLTPEQCPLIPWTFPLANPARLRTTSLKVHHLLNATK